MERPALKRLLDDVGQEGRRRGRLQDRPSDPLPCSTSPRSSRSSMRPRVSFVSVTQSFNTTTSMGRLTLNVLLSFAQFEREVTGERIRDKIAASKRKGMFMGGNVPLGYDLADHSLVINDEEAATVRTIFDLYLRLGTVRQVRAEFDRLGLRSKRRGAKTEHGLGNQPAASPLASGTSTTSQEPDLHRQRQAQGFRSPWPAWSDHSDGRLGCCAGPRPGRRSTKVGSAAVRASWSDACSMLAGNRLTPTHAVKGCRRYRYYATTDGRKPVLRLPAADLENAVVEAIASWLNDFGNSAALARDAGAICRMLRQGERTCAAPFPRWRESLRRCIVCCSGLSSAKRSSWFVSIGHIWRTRLASSKGIERRSIQS